MPTRRRLPPTPHPPAPSYSKTPPYFHLRPQTPNFIKVSPFRKIVISILNSLLKILKIQLRLPNPKFHENVHLQKSDHFNTKLFTESPQNPASAPQPQIS